MKRFTLLAIVALSAFTVWAQDSTPADGSQTPAPELAAPSPSVSPSPSPSPAATTAPSPSPVASPSPSPAPSTSPIPASSPSTSPSLSPAAAAPETAKSRVFAVNLWSAPVDIKLGADGLYLTSSLSADMASQIVAFSDFTPRSILYRASGSDSWQESKQGDGKVLYYGIKPGKTYLILVQSNGVPGLYELNAPEGTRAKVAVVNDTPYTLPLIQIGSGFNAGTAVTANGLSSGWTNFAEVQSGNYGAFWTFPQMPTGIGYYYSSGKDGKSVGLSTFADGGWYVLVIWNDAQRKASGGVIWDISPGH